MIAAFVSSMITLLKSKISDPTVRNLRTGLMISLMGFFLSGWTVHYWNATYALFMFFVGSALWFGDYRDAPSKEAAEEAAPADRAWRSQAIIGATAPPRPNAEATSARSGPNKRQP